MTRLHGYHPGEDSLVAHGEPTPPAADSGSGHSPVSAAATIPADVVAAAHEALCAALRHTDCGMAVRFGMLGRTEAAFEAAIASAILAERAKWKGVIEALKRRLETVRKQQGPLSLGRAEAERRERDTGRDRDHWRERAQVAEAQLHSLGRGTP